MTAPIDINLEDYIQRLYSQDANDRVKAASELGEIGTPDIAHHLLKVSYEDEASTVRQMAIQSYSEILGENSLKDVIKASFDHFDDYVRLYAVMILGRIGGEDVKEPLSKHLQSSDYKIQAATLKSMIHAETDSLGSQVFEILQSTSNNLVIRNCIEALAMWKFKDARDFIRKHYFDNSDIRDIELKTISAFYLGVIGEKSGIKYIEKERIDNYLRIAINDVYYRGKDGLLDAISKI